MSRCNPHHTIVVVWTDDPDQPADIGFNIVDGNHAVPDGVGLMFVPNVGDLRDRVGDPECAICEEDADGVYLGPGVDDGQYRCWACAGVVPR